MDYCKPLQKRIKKLQYQYVFVHRQRKEANAKLYIIGSGTGFFVSAEGHIVSNDHVVGICRKVASKIDGEIKYFNVIKTDEVNDLGIVKGEYKNPTYLSIKTDGAEYGEDIVAFGYPLADALSTSVKLTRGIVSSLSGPGNNYSESYMQYLVAEIEYLTGLTFNKGERITANGGDRTEVVLVSPNGTQYKIEVADNGTLTTTQVV